MYSFCTIHSSLKVFSGGTSPTSLSFSSLCHCFTCCTAVTPSCNTVQSCRLLAWGHIVWRYEPQHGCSLLYMQSVSIPSNNSFGKYAYSLSCWECLYVKCQSTASSLSPFFLFLIISIFHSFYNVEKDRKKGKRERFRTCNKAPCAVSICGRYYASVLPVDLSLKICLPSPQKFTN